RGVRAPSKARRLRRCAGASKRSRSWNPCRCIATCITSRCGTGRCSAGARVNPCISARKHRLPPPVICEIIRALTPSSQGGAPLTPLQEDRMDENRKKALSAALSQIEKQFGKGSVMRLGDSIASRDVEVVSTGSLGLDLALGVGGLPRGRVVEIYGPESSGKTTLTLQVVAEIQKQGGTAAFVDAEHALDPVYAEKVGVNVDDLLISQPDTGEQALEITDMLVRSGAVDVIIVDSVAA